MTLNREYDYEICLRHIHIKLKTNQMNRRNDELWTLSTNLVDRSPSNPNSAISYFTTTKGQLHQDHLVPSVVFYPLETHHLERPTFNLQKIGQDQDIVIEFAYIQLEIRKTCSVFQNV